MEFKWLFSETKGFYPTEVYVTEGVTFEGTAEQQNVFSYLDAHFGVLSSATGPQPKIIPRTPRSYLCVTSMLCLTQILSHCDMIKVEYPISSPHPPSSSPFSVAVI